jgi:murein DD-endopeptidase MepM/ murein hydrolase activator NlpD
MVLLPTRQRLPVFFAFCLLTGCASSAPTIASPGSATLTPGPAALPPAPTDGTLVYHVKRGDTLWRIAQQYGIDPGHLAVTNHLADSHQLKAGQRLLIPELPPEIPGFRWPLRGRAALAKWPVRAQGAHGLDISASPNSVVRAARSGRVAVATSKLLAWGHTVVVDHGDGYATVYCRMQEHSVEPGASVRQGQPVGRTGSHPLYFEIRRGTQPVDPTPMLQ